MGPTAGPCPDWTPVGVSLIDGQVDRRTCMFGHIVKAKNAIDDARDWRERPVNADPVHEVFGDEPVEFATAGELADLMRRVPAETPVVVAHAIRIDEALVGSDDEERTAAAARALVLPQMVRVAGDLE
ncbi:MAG: hypothetical protein JXA67_16530, partial [Micromonosporaceae bacterium]|nr:hypothetical protein [Micromonosporaceae bacterium]